MSAARSPSLPPQSQTSAAAETKQKNKKQQVNSCRFAARTGQETDRHSLRYRPEAPFSCVVCWTARPSRRGTSLRELESKRRETRMKQVGGRARLFWWIKPIYLQMRQQNTFLSHESVPATLLETHQSGEVSSLQQPQLLPLRLRKEADF